MPRGMNSFKKGVSGNPAGLKPGTLLFTPLLRRKLLEAAQESGTNIEVIIGNYIEKLKEGKPTDVEGMLTRTDGKPAASPEDPGSLKNPIHHLHKVQWE